jgi:drug/metabolite transporter (DMT)-like permease
MKTSAPPSRLADASLLAITALWGITFVTVQDALGDADTLTFLTLRFSLAALVAAVLARRALLNVHVWKRGALLGLFLFGGYFAQTKGLESTTPSRSAFITGLTVLFVPLFSWWFNSVRPTWWFLAGAAMAVTGLFVLTGTRADFSFSPGDWLTLLCAALFGLHVTLTQKFAPETSPTALVTVQLLVTAGLSAVGREFITTKLQLTSQLLIAIAITGVLASALAISIQAWAQARTSAVRASLFFSLEPVFALLWSAGVNHSWPSGAEWLGGALMISGVVLAEVGPLATRRTLETRS